MDKQPCVYILFNRKHGTIYIGVTSDLMKRLYQHRNETVKGFTKQHGVKKLARFELYDTMDEAIKREKQLKNWHRDWKTNLVERDNPEWIDLAVNFGFEPV